MNKIGLCSKCKEWTDIDDPCCGAPVWYEGDLVVDTDEDDEIEIK